jgi:hypothetical protein
LAEPQELFGKRIKAMGRIQEEILDAFYTKLSASETVGPLLVEEIRRLFASGYKLKADDLVRILSQEKKKDAL